MKKLILILFLLPLFILGQGTITNPWTRNGNISGNNTDFLGPRDNRSLRFNTNNILRFRIDSLGTLKAFNSFSIDASGGVNTINPKKWSIQPYAGDNSYMVMYAAQNIPGNTNYTLIWDSTITKLNAAKILILGQGSANGLTIQLSQVNGVDGAALGGGLYQFSSCLSTATSAVNNIIPMMKYGSHTYSLSGGTATNFYIEQRQAPNIKSSSPTTLTNYQPYNFPAPVLDAGVTITNDYGLRNDNNFTTQKMAYIGGLVAPTVSRLTLAAGNATMTAIKFTNQTAVTSPAAGEMYYRTAEGFNFTGNMTTSGNATVVGTMSVGSTATVGAGLRVVGALSVTTTFSAGTTSTLAGNTRIGGTAAPNGALSVTGAVDVSTTFSCGTTATLAGNTRIGGTTVPNGALSVTGAIDASTTFSCGSTATIGAGLRCVGAASVVSTLSVGSTCTFAASVRIGSSTAPTALLHLAAGTTAASSAPLKFTSGTNMTTAEAGAMEYDGTNLFFTPTGTTRLKLIPALTGSATLDFPSTLTQTDSDLTITVTGAADGDPVDVGPPNGSTLSGSAYTAWVSSSNTVTVRFSVYGLTAKDPASGTFKVTVFKN